MLRLFIIFFLASVLSLRAYSQSTSILDDVRHELFYDEFDLEKGTAFYEKILTSGEDTPTLIAYQAAARALIAKYTWNPMTKLSSLKSVENLLKNAVGADEDNLEIRFLRFYIENSIPSYLGYSKNIKEDGELLKNNLDVVRKLNLDKRISDYIIEYVNSVDLSKSKRKIKASF